MNKTAKKLFAGKSAEEKLLTLSKLLVNQSVLLSRSKLGAYLGQSYGGDRDIYTSLGYPKVLTFDHYYSRYERQDIATRIVNAYPDASWRLKPKVEEEGEKDETEFEREWNRLIKEKNVYHYIRRIDRISGIGQYGVLFLGFDDMLNRTAMENPVSSSAKKLLFLRPYNQNNAKVHTWVDNHNDPRFGLPLTYSLSTADNPAGSAKNFNSNIIVHWTRVLHVAEDMKTNDVEGTPRLKNVYNRLQDLELVVGSSAEMWWRGAFPGYGFVKDPDADIGTQDMSDLEDEIKEYMHGLKRYIRLQGMSVDALTQQIPTDPAKYVDIQLKLISGAKGIPVRILTGSERGELASGQDETNWGVQVDSRRKDYNEPMILRPLINRLIEFKVLPEPKTGEYSITWPDIFTPSEKESADTNKVITDALVAYSNSQLAGVVPLEWYLMEVLQFNQDQVNKAVEMQDEMLADESAKIEENFQDFGIEDNLE